MNKIYCEHGALSSELKEITKKYDVELIYFPYDLNSRTIKISKTAIPSSVTWENIHIKWEEMKYKWEDFSGSDLFDKIKTIIGGQHKNDILHVDSAYKSKCICMISRDSDILDKSIELEELTGLKYFHPDNDIDKIKLLVNNL